MDDFLARHDNNMRSIALEGIEFKATSLAIDAGSVVRYLDILDNMPVYETRAEDAVNKAEDALTVALAAVQAAKERMAKFKP